jgi:GNAT superfamily N-acetyltransferase
LKPLRQFVPLHKTKHDRASFDCGTNALNTFFHRYARQGMDVGVNYTWVLPAAGASKGAKKQICAWYTLSVAHIRHESLPHESAKHLPHYPLQVFVLGQLAVDVRCQGQGLGDVTLINALRRCARLSQQGKVASVAVIVDVLDDDAMHFYRRYSDFKPLDPYDKHALPRLFIPMHVVRQL